MSEASHVISSILLRDKNYVHEGRRGERREDTCGSGFCPEGWKSKNRENKLLTEVHTNQDLIWSVKIGVYRVFWVHSGS